MCAKYWYFISYFPVGYHEIAVKIFFDLTPRTTSEITDIHVLVF